MPQIPLKYIDGTFVPDWLIDLFGRLKVSEPVAQLSINQSSAMTALLTTEGQVSGSNTSATYSLPRASTILGVGTTTGLRRMRSRVSGLYQPGKPLLMFQTFVLGVGQTNVVKRVGYFWGNNGIFLEQNGTDLNFVLRSGVSGSLVENRVNQLNWNVDIFDGSQAGYDFDPTKSHILFIAFEWLGVGDVVVGFVKDRTPIVAHVFRHPNAVNGVYMSNPALFPTWEIERIGAGGTAENLEAICASLQIEGSLDQIGSNYSIRMPITQTFNLGAVDTFRPIAFLSLQPTKINSRVRIKSVDIIIQDQSVYHVVVVRNPVISGAYTPTWTDKPNRSTRYWFNTSNVLSVTNVESNEIWATTGTNTNKASSSAGQSSLESIDYFGSTFDNTPELFVVCVAANTANVNVLSLVITLEEQA